ncbi:hypothetical protein UZ967_24985, partial [Escherichia coli]|nr:hypothetical protein [Escherichia coli]
MSYSRTKVLTARRRAGGVALALLTTFTLASETALAYEQDKTYKITVLHTNDHHGHFWR